jgi:chemotaxis protein methyltransferase CheR
MAFTFFFRDIQTLEVIAKHFIPYVAGRSKISVWDAGSAMGPEPYSLAIILAEQMGRFAFRNLYIYATDYEYEFGKIINEGIYSWLEIERMPEEILKKYFVPEKEHERYKLVDPIRERVIFQHHDLLTLKPIGEGFSLILCKNVLLHFQPPERIEVMKMFHAALAPGGLFATEHTQKIPDEISHLFESVSSEAQLFRKVG